MKRIIYGIGGTGSAVVAKLKSISDKKFNDSTIYKIWDIDKASDNLQNLEDTEKKVNFKEDIRSKIKAIRDDRHNNSSLYDEIFDVFPIDDEQQINFLPTTQGIGAAKQPIVSRLAGTILANDISKIICSDCELADDGNAGDAYLILSACGGTSSGLNIQIYIELIKQGFNIFLFFVSPNYFNEVSPDKRDRMINAANTVASFLRIYYDLENKKIIYADDNGLDIKSQVYPFIIESEWSSGKSRAEFIENPEKNNTSEDFFYAYNALAISSVLRINDNKSQTFISSYMNDFHHIEENKSFFNMLLLYPVNNTRDKVIQTMRSQLEITNKKNGRNNLETLLSKSPEYELLMNAQNVLTVLKGKIEHIENEYSIKDIYNILMFSKTFLDDHNTRPKWDTNNSSGDTFSFQDDENELDKRSGFLEKTIKFFKNIWGSEDEEPETAVSDNRLNHVQKNAVRELYDYLNGKIKKYNDNLSYLRRSVEFPFNPINFDVTDNSELNIDITKFFNDDFQIETIVNKTYEKIFLTKIDTPPSLGQWHESHKIYSNKESIDNNYYLINIHTEIPDHALGYLRGKNIKYFTERRKKKFLCYPDKRLNGIYPPDKEIFENFLIWEDKTIKSLSLQDAEFSSVDEMDIAMSALSYISDSIDKAEMPKKILDFNKNGDNYYIKAILNFGKSTEKEISGKETPNWYEAAQLFEDTIKGIETDDPFETRVTTKVNIPELIKLSHKQVLDYCLSKNSNSCLISTYQKLKNLKATLPKIENKKIEEINELIDDMNIYLTQLAVEYKKKTLESELKIPDLPIND